MYCIDTSALVHGWQRVYPRNHFPSFWERVDDLIASGRLISPMDVFHELQKKDDDLFAWAKERKEAVFHEVEIPVQEELKAVLKAYPRILDTRKQRDGADPVVIAMAKQKCAIVVTQEGPTGKPSKPHIPDV